MKKHLKAVFTVGLLMLLSVAMVACSGNNGSQSGTVESDSGVETKETFTVQFSNTSISNKTVEKGSVMEQPADPNKNDAIFGGWYLDEAMTVPAKFPITVDGNLTIYAKYYDLKTAFAEARKKTIGNDIPGFEYDYTSNATATVSAVAFHGNTVGNAKYSTSGEISFYDAHENSGSLFYDGSVYQIRRGNTLQKISLNEDGLLNNYSVEEVDDSYRFDSSSFAKALFEYDDTQLKSIEKTSVPNEYRLKTSFNASSAIALASRVLNNSTVQNALKNIPENNVETGMYVTFSGGEIQSYRYEMKINVSAIQFTWIYQLTFKNVGSASDITPRTFSGLSITAAEIVQMTNEVNGILNAFVAKQHSGYDFTISTGVEFPSKNSIDTKFQGSALRKVDGNTVYFHNDIEIDSDLKNADLYKSAGLVDVHIKKTRLSNGEVWLIEKKLLTDATTQISPYQPNQSDSYYLLGLFDCISGYTFVQKTEKDGVVIYSLGISSADIAGILSWVNEELKVDPTEKTSVAIHTLGEFTTSSVTPDEVNLTLTVKNGALSGVSFQTDGSFRTAYSGSSEFTAQSEADYQVNYSLTVNAEGDSFEPYSEVKKAK